MKHNGEINNVNPLDPKIYWTHDVSGQILRGKTSVILDRYFPDIIDEWFDCKIGGYQVEFEKDGVPFKLAIADGLRGIDIPGIIVFTNQGSAYVFY